MLRLLDEGRAGPLSRPASFSVVLGQKHAGHRTVSLRNHPELHAVSVAVDREEPEALAERELVLLPVLGADLAPVARRVAGQGGKYVLGVERLVGVPRRDQPAEREGWC